MKEYANTRYDQPYQAALYENSVLLEAQRWHTDEYEKVIGGLEAADLEVWDFPCQHTPNCNCFTRMGLLRLTSFVWMPPSS